MSPELRLLFPPIRMILSPDELLLAAAVAAERDANARREGHRPKHGYEGDAEQSLRDGTAGAAAEIVVARYLGTPYVPEYRPGPFPDIGRDIQVRATPYMTGRLRLHRGDRDHHRFVLVVGMAPVVYLSGWLYGRDGKRREWWEDPTGKKRWAFFVPREQMLTMAALTLNG